MKNKIINKAYGIVTYGITPPKSTNDEEKIKAISKRQIERIKQLKIDGLIIYDIQDESIRTSDQRPFDFISTVDSSVYANKYMKSLEVTKVVYRCVGNYDEKGLADWLNHTEDALSVFVGAASKYQDIKLGLSKAYSVYNKTPNNVLLGAVMIPERHIAKGDEPSRMAAKVRSGCQYFISQAVYDLEASKVFLKDYQAYFQKEQLDIKPILFTLTPCGSEKTLKFIKWLGVHVPKDVEKGLIDSEDMLGYSIELCKKIVQELYDYSKKLGIPIGCNVESVSIRKEEILGSIKLCQDVKAYLEQ